MECRKGQKRLLAVKVAVLVGLAAGVASAATMTQLVNGPSDIRVAPLVQASWAQGDVNGSPCYNSKTPNNYVCGCVATAAGQIMRKWQYPAAAPARVTNGDCKIDGTTTSQTMRGGPDVPYEWTNMPLAPAVDGESLSAAQREAIGTLLYDIGVATGMNWRNDGASTSTSILAGQFTSTFGYANAAIAGNPSGTGLSLEQFKQAVLPCLDAGMPVVVGIGGANTSHSVVCDGYGYQDGDLYIHLNMGNAVDSDSSADYNNTWYKFPTNNPEGNDVSLWSGGEQSYLNPVVYNISPTMQKGWSIVSGRILSGGIVVEGAEVVAVNASGEGVATAASNAKGIYALALPAGTYTLRAVDSDETKGARVSVTVVATEGAARSDGGAENVVIGNQHGVDISLAEIGSDFLADETPDEYIDYVESDGNQYVDTGVEGRRGVRAMMDVAWTGFVDETYQEILGAASSAGRCNLCDLFGARPSYSYGSNYGTFDSGLTSDRTVDTVYHVITEAAAKEVLTINGYTGVRDTASEVSENFTTGLNLYLFARNNNGSGDLKAKARLYYAKIWLDGVLVRDFVPCKKGGRAALYDKVTRTIFYSRSGTDLIASDYTISTVGQPDAYLDYVESDGNQYIDTGVLGNAGIKSEVKMEWLDKGKDWVFIGARVSNGDTRFNLVQTYNSGFGYGYGIFGYWSAATAEKDTLYIIETEYTATQKRLVVNGKSWMNEAATAYNSYLDLYMFAMNYNGTASNIAQARCYSTKIWQTDANGEYRLLRDYVPCKKNGEPGLYDKVTKSIFVSKGSKPLIAGPVSSVVEEPDEFLDYVESDGNQYIDTGVNGRAGTKAETEFSMDASTADPSYLLAAYGNNLEMYFCWLDGSDASLRYVNAQFCATNTYWGYNLSTKGTFSSEFTLLNKSIVKLTGKGESTKTVVTDKNDSYSALYAFARNNAGTVDGHSSVKLYSMKIWQTDANGEYRLLRDYVPCKKNGEPGLYDKVTKSIFYSKGTKPLIAGSLPGYPDEILDYVESDGNQYIDTGVEGRRGVKAMMDVAWTGFVNDTYQEILGAASSAGRCNLCDLYGARPSYSYGGKYGIFNSGLTSDRTIDTVYHVITEAAAKEVLTINGYTGVRNDASEVPENFTTGLNLYIFARNNNGSGDLNAKARLYYAKIWLDGVLVRDFVPCRKDGVAGLWDRVSKTIFYSQGSKQLIADNSTTLAKIGTPDSFVEYVESDGTQYIDTGVIGKAGTKAEMTFSANESNGNPSFLLASKKDVQSYMNFCYFGKGLNVGFGSHHWDVAWDSYDRGKLYVLESEYSQDQKVSATLNGDPKSDNGTGSQDGVISLYAFARHELDGAVNGCCAKLFSLKIEQTDANGDYQPKRDFVPCVKDGKAALYDSITGMIYYPQGGDLTASEDEVPISSARWIGGTVTSVADLANTANWKSMQGGLVVYGKTPVTVSGGEATLNCPVTLDEAADWSAAGIVSLASGVTIDLNGHVLATAGFAVAEGATDSVLKNLPKGWKVKKSTDGRTLTIVKIKGVMIIAK